MLVSVHRALTEFGIALILDTDGLFVIVEQNSDDLLLAHNVQVGIVATLELVVHIAMGGVLTPSIFAAFGLAHCCGC
jgi:hypothetical protein